MKSKQQHSANEIDTEEREEIPASSAAAAPRWCPEQQIYVGGVVPDNSDCDQLLSETGGSLRLFGYGSLCWNPGQGAVLSRAEDGVTHKLGRAVGYKRCWAQRSADHRGTPLFGGLVCTLLTDDEVSTIRRQTGFSDEDDTEGNLPNISLTKGVIYTVPPHLVDECLAELDFREKGGYERDVIDVIEDDSGSTVQALLYRGTPENPAFWSRALLDLPFAAAVMSVAVGPSGANSEYLYNLDHFLRDASSSSPAAAAAFADHTGDSDTVSLAEMTRSFQNQKLYFLYGCGSNQHRQLLLTQAAGLKNGDEAHELKEIILISPKAKEKEGEGNVNAPKALYCGGGHSGLLTEAGELYLWGWNEYGQLGREHDKEIACSDSISRIEALDIQVEKAVLGHSHTLIIEQHSGRLLTFGDNGRGQVNGFEDGNKFIAKPNSLNFAKKGENFIDCAAGLFHSAAINSEGELLTFGCKRFGQCVHTKDKDHSKVAIGRWHPEDGSKLVKVACGQRHTICLDEHGRIWTMGNNKYGQLGRKGTSTSGAATVVPHLVDGPLGKKGGAGCIDIGCGWSHNVVMVQNQENNLPSLFGFGRNDKGQLGSASFENVLEPQLLHRSVCGRSIQSFSCGSESTVVMDIDGKIFGCGWNEHGNLGIGNQNDTSEFVEVVGARISAPPPSDGRGDVIFAAGGSHFIALRL